MSNTETQSGSKFWYWLLPLLIIIGILFFYLKGCGSSTTAEVDTAVDTVETGIQKFDFSKTLQFEGVDLKVRKGGLEEQIINFLKSPTYENATNTDLKKIWFNFDNINFEFNSASKLVDGSNVQLENLVKILKRFPGVKVKIGAYADAKGNEQTNLRITNERANFIKNELLTLGASEKTVVAAQGYGKEFATVPATASEEERAKDRKVSIRFVK